MLWVAPGPKVELSRAKHQCSDALTLLAKMHWFRYCAQKLMVGHGMLLPTGQKVGHCMLLPTAVAPEG